MVSWYGAVRAAATVAARLDRLSQAASGTTTSGQSPDDTVWRDWQAVLQKYTTVDDPVVTTAGQADFWLIVSFPKKNYSEQFEWHEEIPMLVPVSGAGTLKGIARNKAELDEIVTSEENIHLTYKVKVTGEDLIELLEFLAKRDMIERQAT